MLKRVLFIESGVYGGGSFISLKKHLKTLERDKIQPIVIFFNDTSLSEQLTQEGVLVFVVKDTVFSKDSKKLWQLGNALFMKGYIKYFSISFLKFIHRKSIREITNICRRYEVDYIHLNTELFRDRVGLLVGANLKIPVISHLRSKYELGSIKFNKEYINFANSLVKKFIAVSQDTAKFWIDEVGILEDKCMVLYDYYEFDEPGRLDIFPKENTFNLVCIANLIPVKAHHFLIESIAPLLKKHGAVLYLVGRGEERYVAKLKKFISDKGIEKNVKFLGFRNDVVDILAAADIVLLFSKREGLPNVILESMGLGKITVATAVGGIPEVIINGENGFLIEYGNSKQVRTIIENIFQGKEDLLKIGENAKSTVQSKFTQKHYTTLVSHLYE